MNTPAQNTTLPLVLRFAFDRHIIDVNIDPNDLIVQEAIRSPKALTKLAERICEARGVEFRDELDQPVLRGLPNLGKLRGRWMAGSPMGMEYTIPAPAWCFEERLAFAIENPMEFALLEGDLGEGRDDNMTVDTFLFAIREAVGSALSDDAIVGVVQHSRVRSALDHIFDQV